MKNKELIKRIITALILIPIVVFIILSGKEFFILLLICCENIENISANDEMSLINNKQVVFLDVRTELEYNEGHIDSAILIPIQNQEF